MTDASAEGGMQYRLRVSDPSPVDFDGYALPRRFQFDAENIGDGKSLNLLLRVVGETVEVEQVAITSPREHERVLGSDIRAAADRLTYWKEFAIRFAAFPASTSDGVMTMHAQDFSRTPVRAATRGERPTPRQRRRVNDENKRLAAQVIRDNPDDPLTAVMGEFEVGRRAAEMWMKRAKDAGLLDDESEE